MIDLMYYILDKCFFLGLEWEQYIYYKGYNFVTEEEEIYIREAAAT